MAGSIKYPAGETINQILAGDMTPVPISLDSNFEQVVQHNLGTKSILAFARVVDGVKEVFMSPHFETYGVTDADKLNYIKVKFDKAYTGYIVILGGQATDAPVNIINVITDAVQFTPVFENVNTVSSHSMRWRRVGECMEVEGTASFTGTAPAAPTALVIPDGHSLAVSKLPTIASLVGLSAINKVADGNNEFSIIAVPATSITKVFFSFFNLSTYSPLVPRNGDNMSWETGNHLSFKFSIPIEGWSTNVQAIPSNISPQKAGFLQASALPAAPAGWMVADGSELLKASFPALYTNIGDTYNTCTNPLTGAAYSAPATGYFRIPDYRGVNLRAVGDFADNSKDVTLGEWKTSQLQDHQHHFTSGFENGYDGGNGGAVSRTYNPGQTDPANISVGGVKTSASVFAGTETRTDQVGVYWLIKLYDDAMPAVIIPTKEKQYVAGQTYNGVPLTVTHDYGNLIKATFIPKKTNDGTIILKGFIRTNTEGGSDARFSTIAGITFSDNFPIWGITDTNSAGMYGLCQGGASTVWSRPIAGTTTGRNIQFEAQLTAWPTWADTWVN